MAWSHLSLYAGSEPLPFKASSFIMLQAVANSFVLAETTTPDTHAPQHAQKESCSRPERQAPIQSQLFGKAPIRIKELRPIAGSRLYCFPGVLPPAAPAVAADAAAAGGGAGAGCCVADAPAAAGAPAAAEPALAPRPPRDRPSPAAATAGSPPS